MTERSHRNTNVVSLSEAAELLQLPPRAVEELVAAGYLVPSDVGSDGPAFLRGDLKGFLARNADNGSGNLVIFDPDTAEDFESVDPHELLEALDGRSEEMARRAFEIFSAAFPEASRWSLSDRASFIEQARGRFEAILAVTGRCACRRAEVDTRPRRGRVRRCRSCSSSCGSRATSSCRRPSSWPRSAASIGACR